MRQFPEEIQTLLLTLKSRPIPGLSPTLWRDNQLFVGAAFAGTINPLYRDKLANA